MGAVKRSRALWSAGSRFRGSRAIHSISLSNETFRGGAAESYAAFSAYTCRVGLGSVMVRLTNGSRLLTSGEFGSVLAQTGDRWRSTRPGDSRMSSVVIVIAA